MLSDSLSDKTPIAGKVPSADDLVDLFKQDDTEDLKDDKKEVKAPKETKEVEDEELEEKDDDLELVEPEEGKEEKLDLTDDSIDASVPPRKQEILKKYPDFYKDFPFME